MKKLLLSLSLFTLLSACGTTTPDSTDTGSSDGTTAQGIDINVDTSDWVALQGQGFTVKAPEGWVLTPGQGIDSYVGTISGDGMTLNYDFGLFAGDEFKDQSADFASSKETLDGYDSIIYSPRSSTAGQLGLFMTIDSQFLSMTTEAKDMSERLVLLNVMRSVEIE